MKNSSPRTALFTDMSKDKINNLLLMCFSEVMAFSCFSELMKRMNQNFPHGGAMDSHFANMRSLIQVPYTCMYTHNHTCTLL